MNLLTKIFPREFRERVVEPAYNDLLAEEITVLRGSKSPRSINRVWRRVAFSISCFRVGVPRFFWNAGRPTALARSIALVLVLVGVLVLWVGLTVDYGPSRIP